MVNPSVLAKSVEWESIAGNGKRVRQGWDWKHRIATWL